MTTREAQPEAIEAIKAQTTAIYERAWNEGRIDDLDAICAPNYLRHEPPQPGLVGLAALKQHILAMRTAFPDLTLHLYETINEGTTFAGRWIFQGTHTGPMPGLDRPPTGKRVEITGLFFVHTSNDKAVEEWIYGDTMGMFQQLGLLPPMGA